MEENTNTETLVRRLLSTDYADKVIVTTMQKLGLASDGTYKTNCKERLEPLSDKRMVFIFDECRRSQFGENHKSIKGTSKKPHLVLDSNFSAATALSKCSRSPATLRFCRLVSTKNFFVNFLKLFLRGALKQGVKVPVDNQYLSQEGGLVRFIRIIDITSSTEPPRYIEYPGEVHIISSEELFMIRYGTPGLISIGFEGVISNNLFRLIWKGKNEFQSKFWFYAFQRMENSIYNLSGLSSMPAISFSTLETLVIGFPENLKEQQKIASCLSAADDLINAQAEKIEQLQRHKKGLMQGLFPKIES